MTWDLALIKAYDELIETHPEWALAYLLLMVRAGQLTTETKGCQHCLPREAGS